MLGAVGMIWGGMIYLLGIYHRGGWRRGDAGDISISKLGWQLTFGLTSTPPGGIRYERINRPALGMRWGNLSVSDIRFFGGANT